MVPPQNGTPRTLATYLEGPSDHETIVRPVSPAADAVCVDTGVQRELYGGSIDDTHDISTSRGLHDGEEGAVETVLRVKLNDLLVVVGALEQLDPEMANTRYDQRVRTSQT